MATHAEGALRAQLESRKRRLETTLSRASSAQLRDLLSEVDAALAHMEDGTYGVCEVCHDSVEYDRLLADPLCRFCLDHLSDHERRLLERDLELAGRVQESLLPGPELKVEGWELHAHYQPAGPVSGDYYDLIRPGDGSGLVAVGDVAGKGVAASLLMASLQATLRSLAGMGLPLPDLLARSSRLFCDSTPASAYATLVAGWLRPGGSVEIANAGHCSPLWVRAGGVEPLTADAVPLGLFCSVEYPTRRLDLERGEVLALYTDGISEARNAADEEYGAERLATVLERHRRLPLPDLVQACRDDLRRFTAGARQSDDRTLVLIRRL